MHLLPDFAIECARRHQMNLQTKNLKNANKQTESLH